MERHPGRKANDSSDELALTRRTALKYGVAGVGAVVGSAAFAGGAAASEPACYNVCWVDVKPDSCPNSVNPDQNGVISVAAGWPNFDFETVRLIPVSGEYEGLGGDCQNYLDPSYDTDPGPILELLESAGYPDGDYRSASPLRSTVEDRNGDGSDDTTFHFRVSDLELRPTDTHLVLVGESTVGDCAFVGIDSVRVLDTPSGSNGPGSAAAKGKGPGA